MGDDNLRTTSPRLRRWKALVLVLAALVGAHSTMFGLGALPINTGLSYGSVGDNIKLDDTAAPGYVRVIKAAPDRPLHTAGVRVGDAIRFDRPGDLRRGAFRSEELLGLSIVREGRTIRAVMRLPPSTTSLWSAQVLANALLGLFMVLAGALIATRARQASGVLLGAAMVTMGMPGSYP